MEDTEYMMEEEKSIAQKCSKHTKSTTYNTAVCPFKVEYMDTETKKHKNTNDSIYWHF